MTFATPRLVVAGIVLAAGCSRGPQPLVEDLTGQHDVAHWTLQEFAGQRDGDRLNAVLIVGDTAKSLSCALRFRIGAPTTLESGSWIEDRGLARTDRPVRATSVTFLGGQDGPPSLGGTLELLDAAGRLKYRLRVPTTPLKAAH